MFRLLAMAASMAALPVVLLAQDPPRRSVETPTVAKKQQGHEEITVTIKLGGSTVTSPAATVTFKGSTFTVTGKGSDAVALATSITKEVQGLLGQADADRHRLMAQAMANAEKALAAAREQKLLEQLQKTETALARVDQRMDSLERGWANTNRVAGMGPECSSSCSPSSCQCASRRASEPPPRVVYVPVPTSPYPGSYSGTYGQPGGHPGSYGSEVRRVPSPGIQNPNYAPPGYRSEPSRTASKTAPVNRPVDTRMRSVSLGY